MIMAGTGEITCFCRLRYAYGTYQQTMNHHSLKYGIHMATHLALGLLFLGGGRYTLGTSNAAIACMVAAFFPRFPHISFDNKCFLQALRHLWVLAVEPRCLIARDVDTAEVVYLPIKITMKEGDEVATTQLISPTLIPDLNQLMSIRVDTPRYWPFYLDTENLPRHKEMLLRSQTLYVKRRTAFLSYMEDPKGSRSLFVRSGSSAGDAATLDFPQVTATKTHPAGDLSEFITSFSNDVLFLAFADRLARDDGETEEECLFERYCHASLLDSILQDKPQTLQSHLTLFQYRRMICSRRAGRTPKYFHLRLQDLRFASDFYSMVYERRFSGRAENNLRPPLIRDSTVSGALHALDLRLEDVRRQPRFVKALARYACGETVESKKDSEDDFYNELSWYLLRNGVPVSTVLLVLRQLAQDAHAQCIGRSEPEGTSDIAGLDAGIREVLHSSGTKMSTTLGSGWSVRSLDEIIGAWNSRRA
jgi:anaphase-promoting complex subunit 1